ncbi:hypothetical protein [Histidinibacterium lentulum]|uniref:Uncharacterized protein n=1 Tax=Histidinibacterium lentulum TaxID=2480588 RepID=A0A3N2QVL0_9RHOB|nr:hypothetical protein [Histidinibacterium lentulum]ROT99075.1 hypothetical protein EAT49_15785 [Histidinibacterium lentulum]
MAKLPPLEVPQMEGINYPDPIFDTAIRGDSDHALFQILRLARIGTAASMTEANIKLTPDDFGALCDAMGRIAANGLLHWGGTRQ